MRYLGVILLLCSCTSPSYWSYDFTPDDGLGACSSRIVYTVQDSYSGLELEFLRVGEKIFSYLKIHSGTLKCTDEKRVKINVRIKNQIIEDDAHLHLGGQKLSLRKDLTSLILFSLQDGTDVTIQVEGFETTFESRSFLPLYKRFIQEEAFHWKDLFPQIEVPF